MVVMEPGPLQEETTKLIRELVAVISASFNRRRRAAAIAERPEILLKRKAETIRRRTW